MDDKNKTDSLRTSQSARRRWQREGQDSRSPAPPVPSARDWLVSGHIPHAVSAHAAHGVVRESRLIVAGDQSEDGEDKERGRGAFLALDRSVDLKDGEGKQGHSDDEERHGKRNGLPRDFVQIRIEGRGLLRGRGRKGVGDRGLLRRMGAGGVSGRGEVPGAVASDVCEMLAHNNEENLHWSVLNVKTVPSSTRMS